ncbi:MAG: ABC transporter substrate-binding protein [Candidatus Thermoplasmatota archaeon]
MKKTMTKALCALAVGAMILSLLPGMTAAAEPQDTLIIGMQNDAKNLNPWDPDTNAVWKSYMISWNFETLVAYKPDFELYPVLAAEDTTGPNGVALTSDATGLNITVKIRQGVTFTDGTPLTAKDVAFSYQTLCWGLFQTSILDPLLWKDQTFKAFDSRAEKTHIGVEVGADDYEVKFHLTQNFAMFWYSTLNVPIMPYHIWKDHIEVLDAATIEDYELPVGSKEYTWDYSYGDKDHLDATIGTGPWKMDYWTPGVGAQTSVYEDYWGKNETITWEDKEYPFYPTNIRHIKFKQYGTLDVAILALRKGEIHYIPWNIGPGFYNSLKTDPNIGFEIPNDQGLFYLTFNFRKAPMNDLDFRKAVAYCVDKDYIVNRLLGGYGIKGANPIAITNPRYINESHPEYIDTLNLNKAKDILTAAGYTDKDGDGWRDMPDGSPLKLSILTPPKDYDPTRADAGIMIANNLKSIGLNIESAPTSFDTIVTAAFVQYNFDMYILGWAVGSFPENYLKDFFHTSQDVAINPAGSNAEGYSNATVDAMIDAMLEEMDTDKRVKLVKDICGATMEELAYDTLYYRKSIEAFRKSVWVGWVPAFGTVYNGFSLNTLHPPTGAVAPPTPEPGELIAKLSLPGSALAESTITGQVYVSQDNMPVSGASVEINSTTYAMTPIQTNTNANGYATFDVTLPFLSGTVTYVAEVTAATGNASAIDNVEVVIAPRFRAITLTADSPITKIMGTTQGTSTVYATVTDESGKGVAGVKVYVDEEVLTGTVDSASKTTNATGVAKFTYTAPEPELVTNKNLIDIFKANFTAENMLLPEMQTASIGIGVENDNCDWYDVDVSSASNYVLDTNGTTNYPNSTLIWVHVTDINNVGVSGEDVTITISNDTFIQVDDNTKATNATGYVNFTVTTNSTEYMNISATFAVSRAYATKDSVQLLIVNDTMLANDTIEGFAADIDFDLVAGPNSNIKLVVSVWNKTAALANNTTVNLFMPFVPAGVPGHFDNGYYAWYAGDIWEDAVTDPLGQLNVSMSTSSFATDAVMSIQVSIGAGNYPDGLGPVGYPTGPVTIVDEVIMKRAPLAVLTEMTMDTNYLTLDDYATELTLSFEDAGGPLADAKIDLYMGTGKSKSYLTTLSTDSSGQISYNYLAEKSTSSAVLQITALVSNPDYAIGMYNPDVEGYEGGYPFEPSLPYIPIPTALVLSGSVSPALVAKGAQATFTITVKDIWGEAVEGAMVYGGTASGTTNESGKVVLSQIIGDPGANVFTFTAVSGTNTGTIDLSVFGGIPNFAFSAPSFSGELEVNKSVTITITVTNTGPVAGDATVDLSIGGTVVQSKVVSVPAGGTTPATFTYVPTAPGELAFSGGGESATRTVKAAPPPPTAGWDPMMAIGLAVVLLIVGLLVGLLAGKSMGRPPQEPKAEEEPEAAPEIPEEKPEETEVPETEIAPEETTETRAEEA